MDSPQRLCLTSCIRWFPRLGLVMGAYTSQREKPEHVVLSQWKRRGLDVCRPIKRRLLVQTQIDRRMRARRREGSRLYATHRQVPIRVSVCSLPRALARDNGFSDISEAKPEPRTRCWHGTGFIDKPHVHCY